MMYFERIKQLVINYGLTHDEISKEYIKLNGDKGVSRAMITGMLNGSEEMTVTNYLRLMNAIKQAHITKAKKLNS